MVDQVLKLPEGTAAALLAPLVTDRKGEHAEVLEELAGAGLRARAHRRPHARDRGASEARPEAQAHHRSGGGSLPRQAGLRAAPRRILRDRAACIGGSGAARLPGRAEARGDACSPAVTPAPCAATACRRSNRSSSRSTVRPARAPPATDSASKEFFDPARVVTNPELSLASGAIRGWDRRNAYYFQLIQSLARHYDFDIETPWNELPRERAEGGAVRQRR